MTLLHLIYVLGNVTTLNKKKQDEIMFFGINYDKTQLSP